MLWPGPAGATGVRADSPLSGGRQVGDKVLREDEFRLFFQSYLRQLLDSCEAASVPSTAGLAVDTSESCQIARRYILALALRVTSQLDSDSGAEATESLLLWAHERRSSAKQSLEAITEAVFLHLGAESNSEVARAWQITSDGLSAVLARFGPTGRRSSLRNLLGEKSEADIIAVAASPRDADFDLDVAKLPWIQPGVSDLSIGLARQEPSKDELKEVGLRIAIGSRAGASLTGAPILPATLPQYHIPASRPAGEDSGYRQTTTHATMTHTGSLTSIQREEAERGDVLMPLEDPDTARERQKFHSSTRLGRLHESRTGNVEGGSQSSGHTFHRRNEGPDDLNLNEGLVTAGAPVAAFGGLWVLAIFLL